MHREIHFMINEFIFIIRAQDGQEYEMTVPARQEADAERLLRNLLDALDSKDTIISVKRT